MTTDGSDTTPSTRTRPDGGSPQATGAPSARATAQDATAETGRNGGAEDLTFDREERKIIVFSSAGHFLTHFFMLVFPAIVVPISADLGMQPAQAIAISFWMYLLYGLLAVGWGFVSDHWGHRWAMASGMLVAGIGLTLVGFARSEPMLMAAFAVVGIGCSAYHPSGTALASQGVRRRGKALGIIGIWGNAGIASVPFVAGLLSFALGWRTATILLGAAGTAIGLLALVIPFSVERGIDLATARARAAAPAETPTASSAASLVALFAVLCVGLVFGGFMYRGFTVVLPTFLEVRLSGVTGGIQQLITRAFPAQTGIRPETLTADAIATIVYVIGMIGQIAGGRVADRFSLKWAYFAFFGLALPFIALTSVIRSPLLVLTAGAFVFFALGMQPIENSLIAMLTPARWRSVSYGVKFTLNFGAGSFAVMLMSAAGTAYGVQNSLWLVVGFVALVVINTGVFLHLSRGRAIRQ